MTQNKLFSMKFILTWSLLLFEWQFCTIIRILEIFWSHQIFLIGLVDDLNFFKQRNQMTSEFFMIDEEWRLPMKSNKKSLASPNRSSQLLWDLQKWDIKTADFNYDHYYLITDFKDHQLQRKSPWNPRNLRNLRNPRNQKIQRTQRTQKKGKKQQNL